MSKISVHFQAGMDAYERGDYGTALKEFRPLADQGFAAAQHNLGIMYAQGHGVAQDYQKAVRWYRLAAVQGHASGQFSLGAMYAEGEGLLKDYVLAHMWANLAAAQGLESASEMRDHLEKAMTPAQIAGAQRLAREWKAKGR